MLRRVWVVLPLLAAIGCTGSKQSISPRTDQQNLMEQLRAREEFEKRRRTAMEEQRAKFFAKPYQPALSQSQVFRGPASAPVTIVEYTDFECPYCARGAQTMKELEKKYGEKVRLTVKHLPLPFHRRAMISAQYFEAIALQDKQKAWKFKEAVFENQDGLKSGGESFLEETAKKVGADTARLKKDLHSQKVKSKIEADMAEAAKFGLTGTPAFLVNGVPVKGAQPASEFAVVIDRWIAGK